MPLPPGLATKLLASLSALPHPQDPKCATLRPCPLSWKTRSAHVEAGGERDRSAFLYW